MIADPRAPVAVPGSGAPEPGFGWLGEVLPVQSTRFRVQDPALRAMLEAAGATVVPTAPDVEIGPPHALHGDANLAIAVLGRPSRAARSIWLHRVRSEPPLLVRAVRRAARSLALRASVIATRRQVRRLGVDDVRVVYWDHQMAPAAGPGRAQLHRRALAALPQRALVLGARTQQTPTILDAARAQAARATGLTLHAGPVAVRTSGLIVDTGPAVLRVGIGAGRAQIVAQRRALAQLRAGHPPPVISDRIPWELGNGVSGLAEWSLERKLPGTPAARPVDRRLLSDCVDFLIALHGVDASAGPAGALVDRADRIAAACGAAAAARIRALGRWSESELAGLPRGYAHGDFFSGNLLEQDGRLCGVVDWEAAGPGRLPLLDLLHLRLTSVADMADVDWGPLLVRHLVWEPGLTGDASIQTYAEGLRLDLGDERLLALVVAYWLDYACSQLRTHAHRGRQPGWIRRNVEGVAAALCQARALR